MNKTRRSVRLYLLMILLVLLPFGGFLWSVPGHQLYVGFLAAVAVVVVVCIENIVQQTEREAMSLALKVNEEAADLDIWKEKVRELDRIVAMTSLENEEFRRAEMDRKVHEVQQASLPAA